MTPLETAQDLKVIVAGNPLDPGAAEFFFESVKNVEPDDFDVAHKMNRYLRKISSKALSLVQDGKHFDRFFDLQKKGLLFDAQTDFDAYVQYLEWDRPVEKRFYLPRRKVLLDVVNSMQKLAEDKLDLLTISMPPGTGKSTIGIFFLSWIMGKFPDQPNLASGHSSFLTRSFYDGVLSVLTDKEQYLWADVFPTTLKIDTSAKDTTIHLGKSNRFKTLTTRSIEGSLTGVTRCEKILYADDLVDGIESALSKDRMDKLWQFYTDNLRNRKKEGCKEIHVSTRWSVHDPVGRLERIYQDDERAKFVVLPALNDSGESNFDYAYNLGFSTKYFIDMKEIMDDVSFRALFMNQPIEREGLLYVEDELRRYYELPENEPDAIIGIADTAEGGGDDTFLPVGFLYGKDCYIVDCVCDNGLPEVTDALCAEILVRLNVQRCQFESNSAGGRTADKVQEKVRAAGGRTHITKKRTTANKETKIIVNSSYVKERFVFKDKKCYTQNSPYGKMMSKLCSYTILGKNKRDDVPDGMAQMAEFIQSMSGSVVTTMRRPF